MTGKREIIHIHSCGCYSYLNEKDEVFGQLCEKHEAKWEVEKKKILEMLARPDLVTIGGVNG